MKSTVSIKGMMVALVIFFIGVSLLSYLFLFRPKMHKTGKGAGEISTLNAKVEETVRETNKIREEINRDKKRETNVDYFKRHQIPSEQRTPTFLARVNDLVNQLGIKTIMVKPMPQEESPEYIRYPFLVEAKSKYEEIVKFIDSLENSFGLSLDDLHIENDRKKPEWHHLKFTVSTFELKRADSSASRKPPKAEDVSIEIAVRDDISVKRDPFREKMRKEKEQKVARPSVPPRKKRRKRLPPLKLNGIMVIGKSKVAFMNGKIVREGDQIAKYRVLEIGEDQVVVAYSGKKHTLKIKELVKRKQR